MALGKIDRALPYVKTNALYVLTQPYTNDTQALQSIATTLVAALSATTRASGPAIDAVQQIYTNNFFPEMKASWKNYPDNIGHKDWPGCFRCHDGLHKTADGKRSIKANDCNACHTILAQGSGAELDQLTPNGRSSNTRATKWMAPATIAIPADCETRSTVQTVGRHPACRTGRSPRAEPRARRPSGRRDACLLGGYEPRFGSTGPGSDRAGAAGCADCGSALRRRRTRTPTAPAWIATRTRPLPRPTPPARRSPCLWTRPSSRPVVHKTNYLHSCHADITAKHPDDNVPAQAAQLAPSATRSPPSNTPTSIHGVSHSMGASGAANCWDCHGSHDILPAKDADSPVFKLNLPAHLRQVPQQPRA